MKVIRSFTFNGQEYSAGDDLDVKQLTADEYQDLLEKGVLDVRGDWKPMEVEAEKPTPKPKAKKKESKK